MVTVPIILLFLTLLFLHRFIFVFNNDVVARCAFIS